MSVQVVATFLLASFHSFLCISCSPGAWTLKLYFLDFPADFWSGMPMRGISERLEDRKKQKCSILLASGSVTRINSQLQVPATFSSSSSAASSSTVAHVGRANPGKQQHLVAVAGGTVGASTVAVKQHFREECAPVIY